MTASQTPPRTPTSTASSLRPCSTTTFKKIPSTLKKSTQTTLSASLTPVKPSENPSSGTVRGWDDERGFSGYMIEKQRKLREQFSSEFCASTSAIFDGVVIWVDGYTTPSRLQLRQLVGERGGRLETYFSVDKVTHVVAETLAAATRKRLKNMTAAFKVVTPKWVVDSIQRGVRLPEKNYSVHGMTDPSQKNVASMFKRVGKTKRLGER